MLTVSVIYRIDVIEEGNGERPSTCQPLEKWRRKREKNEQAMNRHKPFTIKVTNPMAFKTGANTSE
jgi:hypothetical protein